ncbi:MAG: hypothetical protein SH847_02845 [Roseiflexaceae bacterium]|nr:hypothetical protein [Roseiflexaceae bacterium]
MLTIDQIILYMEHEIAQGRLEGQREELRRLQYSAGMLIRAAEESDDDESARRFRLVAAQAANQQDTA